MCTFYFSLENRTPSRNYQSIENGAASLSSTSTPIVFCIHGNKFGVARCCEDLSPDHVHEGPNFQLLVKEPEVYQRRQHSEKYVFKKTPKFNCKLCNKPQASASNLKRHIYKVHEGHKDNKCES